MDLKRYLAIFIASAAIVFIFAAGSLVYYLFIIATGSDKISPASLTVTLINKQEDIIKVINIVKERQNPNQDWPVVSVDLSTSRGNPFKPKLE